MEFLIDGGPHEKKPQATVQPHFKEVSKAKCELVCRPLTRGVRSHPQLHRGTSTECSWRDGSGAAGTGGTWEAWEVKHRTLSTSPDPSAM
jgi:hypothetical protein